MSDDTGLREPTSRSERYGNAFVVLLGGLYTAAFVAFIAWFIYSALNGI
jgi:hypothetical protein